MLTLLKVKPGQDENDDRKNRQNEKKEWNSKFRAKIRNESVNAW